MLTLKTLKLQNIGRFVEEQIIDFSNLRGLVQIDGQNGNTSGSSGSGKSTIFEAIAYCLGLNNKPSSVLQSRLTKSGISVVCVFDFDGKPLTIERGKGKFVIELDGDKTIGSSKLGEELLDTILGMPRDLFSKVMYKAQAERGWFLQMGPKETHSFLSDCLGLNNTSKKADKIDLKLKDFYLQKDSLVRSVETNKSSLAATSEAISSFGSPPIQEIDPESIELLKSKLDKSAKEYNCLVALHKIQKEDLNKERPQVSVIDFDRSNIVTLETAVKTLQNQINQINKAESDRQNEALKKINNLKIQKKDLEYSIANATSAEQEAPAVAAEILKIRRAMCPTCEQNWATDLAKTKEAQLLKKIDELKIKIEKGKNAKESLFLLLLQLRETEAESKSLVSPELAPINEKILLINSKIQEERQKEKDHNSVQNEENKKVLNIFAQKQADLFSQHTKELEVVSGQYDLDRRVHDTAKTKYDAYNDAKIKYETTLSKLKNQESSAKEKIANDSTKLSLVEEDISILEELKKAIKGFMSRSFDDALETIGDSSTKMLRNIPNMQNATITLSALRETKAGAVKEEVTCILSSDGEEDVPIKSLSGGERSSVDLAIDLAVIDLIESLTGKGCNLFIADEPFGGLDSINVEQILEMLKNSNNNKTLIIVDHNEIVKEMCDSKITVIRDGQFSRIVQ